MLFASMICALMPASMAHGDFPPKRGGISVNAGEMTLEFVIRDGMVVVYLDDHGEPLRAQGAEATLVLTGSDGAERAFGCVSLAPTPSKRLTSLSRPVRGCCFSRRCPTVRCTLDS